MNIYFNGDSSFLIETSNGKRILLDPTTLIEENHKINPNINLVTISHNHKIKNINTFLDKNIKILDSTSDFSNDFCTIKPFTSFHDNHNGQKRGSNIIFKINCDGLYICHLGHLGHKLNSNVINSLKNIDILFVPVGSYFTIGLNDLKETIEKINPKYIIPMSYKLDAHSSYLKTLDSFLLKMKNYNYRKLDFLSISTIKNVESPTIIILELNKKKTLSIT